MRALQLSDLSKKSNVYPSLEGLPLEAKLFNTFGAKDPVITATVPNVLKTPLVIHMLIGFLP